MATINVQTQNIFPIIKKYLYSDQDIFLRELVSNACDASNKLKHLAGLDSQIGDLGDMTIKIALDAAAKTVTITDRGLGMTEAEVEKYINQIAFSGATEFMDKYKDANIIGHFGLGFYSAFMVADKVELITKSYTGAPAVRWSCEGSPEITLVEDEKEDRGTTIVLHLGDEFLEYLEKSKIQALLDKHCKYYSVPIEFDEKVINNTSPIWNKAPTSLTDEDYINFYNELHPFAEKPLFWIHLNVDYPFNLTGVLYFPKISKQFEVQKNKIQLYCNQVYVTDEVKDIVPEFLQLMHGAIDSPDIPLNVSRSYLQADSNVKKITAHITKKVADKLEELFKNDRKAFEEKWESIGTFVKYGMLTDEKFNERALKFCLLQDTNGTFYTIDEYKEKTAALQTDKDGKQIVLYTNDTELQYAKIAQAADRGYVVVKLDHPIDNHIVQHLEYKLDKVGCKRIDADTVERLIDKDEKPVSLLSKEQEEAIKKMVEEQLKSTPQAMVQLEAMSPDEPPMQIVKPEFIRRMADMQQFQGMNFGDMAGSYNLVLNTNHPTIVSLDALETAAQQQQIDYLHRVALLANGMLKGAALHEFVLSCYAKSN